MSTATPNYPNPKRDALLSDTAIALRELTVQVLPAMAEELDTRFALRDHRIGCLKDGFQESLARHNDTTQGQIREIREAVATINAGLTTMKEDLELLLNDKLDTRLSELKDLYIESNESIRNLRHDFQTALDQDTQALEATIQANYTSLNTLIEETSAKVHNMAKDIPYGLECSITRQLGAVVERFKDMAIMSDQQVRNLGDDIKTAIKSDMKVISDRLEAIEKKRSSTLTPR